MRTYKQGDKLHREAGWIWPASFLGSSGLENLNEEAPAPYFVQNHVFTGEPLHKTDIFCHSDLYSTLQKKRPSTKSRKSCRTVLFYGTFELFWEASIMKMAQKMMDGFIRDTICWQMNCLRSTVAGVYACRQLKAGDAAQPKGCSARFVLWYPQQFA